MNKHLNRGLMGLVALIIMGVTIAVVWGIILMLEVFPHIGMGLVFLVACYLAGLAIETIRDKP